MVPTIREIQIDHPFAAHEIEVNPPTETREFTLLELVAAVSECCDREEEVVATVHAMLASGRISPLPAQETERLLRTG